MPPMLHKSRNFRRRLNRWCYRTSTFMEWTKPNASMLIDSVSGTPLSHITLLCKHLMHGECSCHKCDDMLSDVRIYQALSENHSPDFIPSGSFAEDCPSFPFFVGNKLKGTYDIKRSDFDFMLRDNNDSFPIGFDPKNEPNIRAVIETNKTQPGYLRLRNLESNNYIKKGDSETGYCMEQASGLQMEIKMIRLILQHRNPDLYSGCPDNCDVVLYYPVEVWPPQAECWITRERRSNWPTKETIEEIVKIGCAVVSKAHPSSPRKEEEFRFSFSFAEKILFGKLTLPQKKCFVAFKTMMKFTTYKLEILKDSKTKLKTYHMKTVFLWACETIEAQEWETSQGWANCLLYLIDQLIICLNKMTLPSYFIPDNDLFDEVRTAADLIDELTDEIKRVRQNPLRTAAEMLDSIASAIHFYYSPTSSVQPLSVSCYTTSCDELLLPNINSPLNSTDISDSERQFFFLLYILVRLHRTRFNGCSCTVLEPIAGWYMTNREQMFPERMISHSFIFLNKDHGSEIRVFFKIVVNIIRKFHTSEYSTILQQIFKMLVLQADTLHWLFFSALVLMQANDYDAAREVLLTHIQNNSKWKYCPTINISQIMSEMNYEKIFNNKTINIIKEHDNSYKFVDLFVSSEVFLRFLLSKCYQTLAMETSPHTQLNRIKKLVNKSSKLLLDHLLVGEVAEMWRNSPTSSESHKTTLILIRNGLEDHIISKRKKQKGFQRKWEQICTDYLRPIHSVINCKIDELNGDKSPEMFRRALFALIRKLGKVLNCNFTKSKINDVCIGIQKMLEDVDIFKPLQSNIEKHIHISFNPKRNTRLYEFITLKPNPNAPSFKKLMSDAMAYAGSDVPSPGTEVHFSRKEFNIRMSSLAGLKYLFDYETPALRCVYTSEKSVIEMHRKLATNLSPEIFLRFVAGCIELFLELNVVDLSRVCVSDNDESLFADFTMHDLDFEPAAFHYSLEPYLPCNAALKDMLHVFARKNLPGEDIFRHVWEVLHLNAFVGHMLFSSDSKTIADMIYICQMQIFVDQHVLAIPILEQVISLESANPTSTVIWPEELDDLVDENVRSEIRKSRGECIIVPSVVYALYLLACIHGSLHNKAAYQQTIETFEGVCEYLGKSSMISKRLLEYALDLDENGVIRQNGGGGCTQATKIEGGYKQKRKRRGSGNTARRKRKRNN